jgi:hypothetical protein
MAFMEATGIIEGRDAVKEFLACGIWPLNDSWYFAVEMKESPLSKVTVPVPQVTTTIGERSRSQPSMIGLLLLRTCWLAIEAQRSINLAWRSFGMVD